MARYSVAASSILLWAVATNPTLWCSHAFSIQAGNSKNKRKIGAPSSFVFVTPHESSRRSCYSVFGGRGGYCPLSAVTTNSETTGAVEAEGLPVVQLFNSLHRRKTPLEPLEEGKVSMYTCGPTVYDSAHVGNFRAFLTYDVLKRVLLYFGYQVQHVCNITDVDDKIIRKCAEQNISLQTLTQEYCDKFMTDLEALNIIPADQYPRATQHIDDMVQLILELQKNDDLAYKSEEGSWYFNVAKAQPNYGTQLVQLDWEHMGGSSASPVGAADDDEYADDKMQARDFCLWKAYKPGVDREDAVWDTPLGRGRPGWHLECSAMARRYLGDTIDVHCGGTDLKFPHHENEIAQSEGATGKTFCNCWIHNGFVNIGDEKMSKSKGNFLTLRTACVKPLDVRAYRYLIVSSQYRNPLSFTDAAMSAAKSALKRMDKVKHQLTETSLLYDANQTDEEENNNEMVAQVKQQLDNFDVALLDDLSMPRAAASLFGVVKLAEAEFKNNNKEATVPLNLVGLAAVHDAMEQMDRVFGIFYQVPDDEETTEEVDAGVPEQVMELVQERTAAKEAKDWDLADSLRSHITELGFTVKDVKGGDPLVSRID
eukprot:scaffold82438_cov65-Attheya_sp.AAC.1